ncbi:sulfurtransferase [Yokenella regensburgei]|uniref:sulfurtransferase n=1 Tax=Yokenella regensburgei TaxID=158877 RepID=UPI003F177CE9
MQHFLTCLQIQQQHGAIIDTRPAAIFNGWPDEVHGTSGHEPGALNLATRWLDIMDDEVLSGWLSRHALTPAMPLALYGGEHHALSYRLRRIGFQAVSTLADALTDPARLRRLPGFAQRPCPQWLHQLLQGKPVAERPAGAWRVLEIISDGTPLPRHAHIPGAACLDIGKLEGGPFWNVVPANQLSRVLTRHGIGGDTTVILYSRHLLAAARAAQILLYAGVADVRLLEGDAFAQAFPRATVPPMTTSHNLDAALGVPRCPQLMVTMAQARALLHRQDASLVSVRSWQEHTGQISGYDYIAEKGDIPGARWGHAGEGKDGMGDFLNPDGTLRSAEEITAMWAAYHITSDQHVAFYCGTGWRASLAFLCARAMGWSRIAVYDGGWYEWSQKNKNGATC